MQQNYNIYNEYDDNPRTLTCQSNALSIIGIKSLEVFDSGAYKCNCNGIGGTPICTGAAARDCKGKPVGTFFAGCTGNDEVVEVRFAIDISMSNTEFDVAFYINTQSGQNAVSGSGGCVIQGLSQTNSSGATYTTVSNADDDGCLDVSSTGNLLSHPFPRMKLSCRDPDGDGLLDISVAASFAQNAGECSKKKNNININ